MKINGNEIKPGNVITHQGGLWIAVKSTTVKPGKGPAYNQVELKNLMDGRKLNERFRSAETVDLVSLEIRDYTYLFEEGDNLVFMDQETFEQTTIPKDMIGERAAFLQDGMAVAVESHEGRAINVQLPEHVTLEIVETEPTMKGQTASGSYKPAKADNGLRIMVPPYMTAGERVIVNTETMEYVRRAD